MLWPGPCSCECPGSWPAQRPHTPRCPGHERVPSSQPCRPWICRRRVRSRGMRAGLLGSHRPRVSSAFPAAIETLAVLPGAAPTALAEAGGTHLCPLPPALSGPPSSRPWPAGEYTSHPSWVDGEREQGPPITCRPLHRCPPLALCLAQQHPDTKGDAVLWSWIWSHDSMGWSWALCGELSSSCSGNQSPRQWCAHPSPVCHPSPLPSASFHIPFAGAQARGAGGVQRDGPFHPEDRARGT